MQPMSNLLPALKGDLQDFIFQSLKKFQKKGIKKSLSHVHWIKKENQKIKRSKAF
jgi:hypothetical protein